MDQKEYYSFLLSIYAGILFNAPTFEEGKDIQIKYEFNCPEFIKLKEQYHLEQIAGKGSDFKRALRLCRYLAPRLKHKSDYDNHIECNSLSLLEYCFEKEDVGINCLNKAKILEECLLALGIYARRVGQMPCSPYDGDNHVVVEIYDRKLQKWIGLDPTYGSYFSNGKEPLSLLEFRKGLGESQPVSTVLNRQNPTHIEKLQQRNIGDNWYYAKNSFYFTFDSISTFGEIEDMTSLFVIPKGFDLRRNYIKNLEYREQCYGMNVKDRIAIANKSNPKIISTSIWDSPLKKD